MGPFMISGLAHHYKTMLEFGKFINPFSVPFKTLVFGDISTAVSGYLNFK
jgi:hypothetical protein